MDLRKYKNKKIKKQKNKQKYIFLIFYIFKLY
jgi:hypothetical protein